MYIYYIYLRRGDESQPRVRIFFVSAEKCRGSCLMLFKWATLLIPIVNILNPLVNHHFQTQSSYTKNPNVLLQSSQTSSYNPVQTRLEAQTICSTFGRLLLALQPFAPPSSVSLLIPLQTILFRAPTDAALR